MAQEFRIVQVSDLHLSGKRGRYQDNWEITLEWIDAEKPDLVVVSGDVALSDPDEVDDLVFARRQLNRISAPWRVIPGNHDIGDNVVSGGMAKSVDAERRQRWLDLFGPDYWQQTCGAWTAIGVNAQILNSGGFPAEEEQSAWLTRTLAEIPRERPIALFVHKPLFMDHPSEAGVTSDCLDPEARHRLLRPFADKSLKLVACGHKHQYRSFGINGIIHIWAPATSAVNHPPEVKMWGLREVGFVDIRLGESGGLRQRLVGRDMLFRHESYVYAKEYGSAAAGPEQPVAP
ncbi:MULTISPECIES: metallophosphoesterase [unclassified Chelatococcus]|uniref:metallophosphoesterase family protein n=1 Tax=unclassified Chelatococcus TaxID=2638111 RepID=UPI001BCEE20C|nr:MULTISPECIES: metallophosphoesterase [unclassified Chelatococcus]MBS7700801.1 metallophosphoesterase [Chelatococcus sp. YT9]MBX3559659.1 metallophosphoesterase [Chelatococcus sp.]